MTSHPPTVDRQRRRSQAVDAARGFAMLLVCVSHFGFYFSAAGDSRDSHLVGILGLPASPTFILLSGLILGLLHRQSPGSFAALRLKLIDRGFFLLGPAHLLIAAAHLAAFRRIHFIFITDAVGVCLLIGPSLVMMASDKVRVALGAGILIISWCLHLIWLPAVSGHSVLRAIFLGEPPLTGGWLTFPILPWLGAYVLATPLGTLLADWMKSPSGPTVRLGTLAIVFFALGVLIHGFGHLQGETAREFLSAAQKYPPGPAYLLTAGGIGLGVLALFSWCEQREYLTGTIKILARMGRASLVAFIAQYFVYYVGFFFLHLPKSSLWPLYLIGSMALVFAISDLWQRYFGNRYLTVGLTRLLKWQQRDA